MQKEIPNDIIAEQSVLGAMFLSKYAQEKAIESLNVDSFFLDKHGKIFDAIKTLFNNNIVNVLVSALKCTEPIISAE